jgi:hypothetical protein
MMATGSGTGTPATGARTYATLAELKVYLGSRNSDTFTASASTDILTLTNPRITWSTGDEVEVSSSGTLPSPLSQSTIYYVIAVADLTIKLATSSANATAGTAVDLTTAGSGTHTLTKAITDDDLVQDALEDAASYIESWTGKVFEAVTDTRYYRQDAVDWLTLYLDEDLLSVTTLKEGDEDQTTISSANYWLLPRNEGPPYRRIELKADSDYSWDWTTDGEIEVTGTWGYATSAPYDIRRAVIVLAAYLYRQKDSQVWDVVAVPEAGVVTIPQGVPVTVRRIIGKYQDPLE